MSRPPVKARVAEARGAVKRGQGPQEATAACDWVAMGYRATRESKLPGLHCHLAAGIETVNGLRSPV